VELFAVYDHPAAYPQHFAVRKQMIAADGLRDIEWLLFAHLEQVRSALAQKGLIRVPRGATDDPLLLEHWV
jgi:hypothetical protein